jgi:holo-[acyl-carrier protein] synthase
MKGIGVDTVAMERFKEVLIGSDHGFIEHVFTTSERKYCASTPNPTQTFAGHFAAKEALIKAMPTLRNYGIDWRDIEITHNTFGAPQFVMNENLLDNLKKASASSVLLSISHTPDTAIAMVAVV